MLTKIGGPGYEFYASGMNWELAPETAQRVEEQYGGGILGNWRMEVSPGVSRKEDVFLHLIQVGDTTLTSISPAELIEENGQVGVQFIDGNRIVTLSFAKNGGHAGHITITRDGTTLVDRELTTTVMPQTGLSGSE
jgi:heparin/heparan-sulfate lyase